MIGCDLGSNTFRVVEIDCKTKERVKEFEEIVKTAENLSNSGIINKKAVDRVLKAINRAQEIFDFQNQKSLCVATAAMRLAKNSDEVLKTIKDQSGFEFKIISAKKEAEYTKIAVENRLKKLDISFREYTLLDIGGASIEITINSITKSFDIGIVTMSEKCQSEQDIIKELSGIKKFISLHQKTDVLVATAGTPTTIAAFVKGMDYKNYDYKKVNGTILTLKQIDDSLQKLLTMDKATREKWVGVSRDRLIITGILLLKNIIQICNFKEIIVIDDSLREGVALSQCK